MTYLHRTKDNKYFFNKKRSSYQIFLSYNPEKNIYLLKVNSTTDSKHSKMIEVKSKDLKRIISTLSYLQKIHMLSKKEFKDLKRELYYVGRCKNNEVCYESTSKYSPSVITCPNCGSEMYSFKSNLYFCSNSSCGYIEDRN
jgi:ribosomal protein S27E